MNATLLIELRTEELPPKSLMRLGTSFREAMHKSLAEAGFIDATNEGTWYATPRRLAVRFADCRAAQPDRVVERKGPAVASGIDAAGNPTKALEGFLRSAGVAFAALERVHDGKAEYFVARQHKPGEPLATQLAGFVEAALKKLPVAKLMRWGDGDAQFVRPVHGLVMLHGADAVPGVVLGIDAGRTTRGHRFMSAGDIVIANADVYADTLLAEGRVVAGFEARRRMIRQQLDAAAASLGLAWLEDDALLDEVTALVEHPSVYAAQFDVAFLAVPPECLILTMKANQKYFPLMDGGKLSNRFLVVSNMQVADPANIVDGNARVVRPRLADAKFFYETDKKTPLAARVEKLARVVYHNQLGTQGERVQRLMKLAGSIARALGADAAHAARAALLAKADLVSDMVGEFPELQGIMGRYYALADEEPADVAEAIAAHYHPRGAGDSLPLGNVACAVALADRLDALAGFFGIGQVPTGDKDPFALRRAALGVLRILMETPLPLDLATLVDSAAAGFTAGTVGNAAKAACGEFLRERLRHLLREQGHDAAHIDAVLALSPTRIDRVPAQLAAVRAFAALPEAAALAAANKRIVNILKKSAAAGADVDTLLLADGPERALFHALTDLAPDIESRLAAEDYEGALRLLAGLRDAVDAFFDGVMVNTEEPLLRANRLALLSRLAALMNRVADISRL